jgi:hypothetical protein
MIGTMQDRNQVGSVTCGAASMEMIPVRSRDSVIDIAHNLRTKGLCNKCFLVETCWQFRSIQVHQQKSLELSPQMCQGHQQISSIISCLPKTSQKGHPRASVLKGLQNFKHKSVKDGSIRNHTSFQGRDPIGSKMTKNKAKLRSLTPPIRGTTEAKSILPARAEPKASGAMTVKKFGGNKPKAIPLTPPRGTEKKDGNSRMETNPVT